MTSRITRGWVAGTISAVVIATLAIPGAATATTPATVDFSGGTWNGETGFPLDDMGGTGIDGVVGDLGGGLTVTLNYAEVGTAKARGRDGTTYGNLNILDAAAVPDLANPGDPLPPDCRSTTDFLGNEATPAHGCHETSGMTFNMNSTGANNTEALTNYLRYDFTFNQLVTVPNGVTLGDIDSLRLRYEDAFPRDYQVDLYQDAIGFELWTDAPGNPGSGVAPATEPGSELVASSLDGVSYVHSAAAPLGGRGGLTDSDDVTHQATFTAAEPIRGFSIYYWDELADSRLDPGVFPTVSIENFEVVPVDVSSQLLRVTKSSTPTSGSSVPPGDTITYTLTIQNVSQTAVEVAFTDHLTAVLDDTQFVGQATSDTSTVIAEFAGEQLSLSGSLPAGGTATVTYAVTALPWEDQGDHVVGNFLTARGEEPPAGCTEGSSLCTTHQLVAKPDQDALAASGGGPHTWTLAIIGLLALGSGALILNRRRHGDTGL